VVHFPNTGNGIQSSYNYDIASSTCNQVWGSATASSCTSASTATAGMVLVTSSSQIAFAEYAAENNCHSSCSSLCSSGGTGNNTTTWPCRSDAVCAGTTYNGHGRGMCQWGSSRWATQGQTYSWILDHYYSVVNWSLCSGGAITPPACSNDAPCSATTLSVNSSCSTTNCSTVNATPPSPDIPYNGASTCATNYQTGRYDDDVWFKITPSSSNPVTITVTPTSNTANFDASVGIYQGSCSSLTQIGCADSYGVGAAESVVFTPSSGSTYYIRVFSYGIGSSYSGNFSICAVGGSCTDQFESNNSSGAATLVFANPLNSGSSNYTLQGNMGFAGDQDWYRVNIQACGTLTVNLANLPYNYDLELWNSSASSALDGSYSTGTSGEQVTFTSSSSTLTNVYIKVYANPSGNYSTASCYNLQYIWTPGSCPCTVPSTPATPTSNSPQCGSVTISRATPPSGVTWYWQGTSCGTSMSNSNSTYTANQGGTYYLRAYNTSGGCWSANCASTSVIVNSPPSVSVNPTSQTGCTNQNVSFTANGANTYTWSGQGVSGQNTTVADATYTSTGTYRVTVTGTSNGCSASATASVVISGPPTNVNAGANPNPVCAGNTVNLTSSATNANTYSWSSTNGFSDSQQNTSHPNVQQSGIYTVSASNSCGTVTASVNVNVNQAPATPAPVANANPICQGATLNLSVIGGTSWLWSGPNGYSSTQQNPQINSNIYGSGDYCVVVTQSGCQSAQGCINITVNPKPAFVITASNNNNNVFCTGQPLSLTASNCAYNYLWSNNATGNGPCDANATPVANQTYTATATDANNCSATALLSVSIVPAVTPSIGSIAQSLANPICAGNSVTLTPNSVNGGSNPSYSWHPAMGKPETERRLC
jgi:hypothetical protein